MSTNSFIPWSKANHFQTLSNVDSTHTSIACAEQQLAARTKSLSCCTSIPQPISAGEQFIRDLHPSSAVTQIVHAPLPSKKVLELSPSKINVPLEDKKQRLCLEIWLPRAPLGNDDDSNVGFSPSVAIRRTSGTPTVVITPRSNIVPKPPNELSFKSPCVSSTDPPKGSLPTSVENRPISTNRKNSAMISRFMQKHSSLPKDNLPLSTNSFCEVRLPLLPDRPPLHPRTPSANYRNNPSTTLIARSSSSIKPSHSDIHPQLRLLYLANRHLPQYASSTIPSAVFLTTFSDNKTNEPVPSFQRSRTFQTLADLSSTTTVRPSPFSSPSLNQFRPAVGASREQASCLVSKRMSFTRRSRR